jgi:hypothetical protein
MKELSKREQMQDVLEIVGGTVSHDIAARPVVEDQDSRATGPTLEKAAVIKALLDSFSDALRRVGLNLVNAHILWESDESAEQIYDRLRGMNLISDPRSSPSLFEAA